MDYLKGMALVFGILFAFGVVLGIIGIAIGVFASEAGF